MTIHLSFDRYFLVAALCVFGTPIAQRTTCPTDCSGCPDNGAYSVAGNMYHCTSLVHCPCNLPDSGCPTSCGDCPDALYNKTDLGSGIELTYCSRLLNESWCSCLSPPLAPPSKTKFVPGAGGVHFVQYQKKNPAASDQTPEGAYHLDIRIFDSSVSENGKPRTTSLIGAAYGVAAFGGQPILVNNTTPWVFNVTSPKGSVDIDPLHCMFDGQSWRTDEQPQCKMGHTKAHGYQDGSRNGDCGFTIPAPPN